MALDKQAVNVTMAQVSFLEKLAGLIFPVECVSCHQEGDWLCSTCRRSLKKTPPELCRICGKYGPTGICGRCQERTGIDGIVSLFSYSQPTVQEIIKAVKYRSYHHALSSLVSPHRLAMLKQLPEGEWVFTATPLHSSRLAERGFNQAEELAKLLALQDYPVQRLFSKTAKTISQVELDRQERLKNLQKAFRVIATAPSQLVICDDVITTGTTLGRLAKLAKKRGTDEVWVITLAHG